MKGQEYMQIRKAIQEDKAHIAKIRSEVCKNMISVGLTQWDEEYPSDEILFEDIDRGEMLIAQIGDEIAGYVTVNKDIPKEYDEIDLQFASKICIHRLSVNPTFLRQGIGTRIMLYLHKSFKAQGYKSICLDTCEDNEGALRLYDKLGYIIRGYVKFPRKEQFRFPVMEIML